MATKKKSFNAELDDILAGLELPSEEEIKEDTRKEKISKTTSGRQKPAGFSEKLSATKKGKSLTEEHLASVREASMKRRGTKLSDEHRAKVSAAGMGRKVSDKTRAKISSANTGRKLPPVSEETRAKKAEAQRLSYANGRVGGMAGKTLSEEARAKISSANKGRKMSDEARAKLSESKKGKSYGGNFKPVLTPYGVFASLKEAGEHEEPITGRKFNPNRFTALLKDPTSGYKRISVEEYIMITGKEVL